MGVDRLHPRGRMMSTPSPRVNRPWPSRPLHRTRRPCAAVGCPLSERSSQTRTLATPAPGSKSLSAP